MRAFRLLTALLLALAIPVQGMAAVVAGQCMAFGHHSDAGGEPAAHVHDAPKDHDHATHSHSEGDEHQPGHQVKSDDDGGAKSAHCGPCTACCASASIVGTAGLWILPFLVSTKYVFSPLLPPGIQPHGLDRPPLAL
jgi:hypothetical protein